MTYFELREMIESAFPWWAPFALPLTILAIMLVLHARTKFRGK